MPPLAGGGGWLLLVLPLFLMPVCPGCPLGLFLWGWSGWVWGVLVGLLFEICIVDASIL